MEQIDLQMNQLDPAIQSIVKGTPGREDQMKINPVEQPQGTGWLCEVNNPDQIYPATPRFLVHGDKLRECVPTPEQMERLTGKKSMGVTFPNGTLAGQYDEGNPLPESVMPPIITTPVAPSTPVVPPVP